jgi:electron transfer flavoprotein alpha subunit
MAGALVLVSGDAGEPDDVSLQALTFARRFAGAPPAAVVVGEGAAAVAAGLGAWGAATVHVADVPALASYAPDAWARVVADLAASLDATAIVAAGTETGNDVLARVAARIDEPFAANCLTATAGDPIALTRIRWGGSLQEEARLRPSRRAVMTVVPHAVAAQESPAAGTIAPLAPAVDEADLVVRVRERIGAATGGVSLADAKVVITGGRGVGAAEGFAPIEDLAGLLGAAVGCSRAVTIAGWRAHTDQVGQTGTKIAPEVYICCGVSGATQHMTGCKGAKRILAINNDPEAPIMASADYAVIGDLHEVVPAIAAEIRRVRAG